MNKIDRKFAELKSQGKKAFMPFITAGDPSLKHTPALIEKLESSGADLLELGIPFSDPVADGPSIQRSSLRSLDSGTTLGKILDTMSQIRAKADIPIAFMSYYNVILRYGIEKFVKDAVEAGVDGTIIPDLPPDEAADLISVARDNDFATIFLLTPTSTDQRMEVVSKASTGFIYCVSLTGVTGARKQVSEMLAPTLDKIRKHSDKPVAVGFGVSTPEQAEAVAKMAEGVIVGSAIVNVIEANADNPEKMLDEVGRFTKKLSDAVKKA
ncbi:tryptophan synthase subunit alpha [Candidatus Poribacteria bacterium]|nr:tryptophan synthase subunit alpha [Candidatus Poribacteria bacterium]